MKKKRTVIIITLVVILIVLPLAVSWYFSSIILYPKSVCHKEHYVYCGDPSEIPLEFENISFETDDKITLRGWYMPADNSSTAVIMVHGHGGSKNEGLRFAKPLVKAGFNVLAYDSRVLAKTGDAFASMGYHEVKDVKAAVDYLTKARDISRVGVLGFSMGGSTAIMAMADDNRIKAGLFSSSYANMVDEMAEVGQRDFGMPRLPILPLAISLINLRGNMDLYEVVPEKSISKISPRPLLIMHCDKDDYVDYSHAQRLFKAAGNPKDMWTAHCDKHEYLWNSDPEKAESVVTDFFSTHLKPVP